MDHVGIIKRAFKITLGKKVLWLFGFIVALNAAFGSTSQQGVRAFQFVPEETIARTGAAPFITLVVGACCLVTGLSWLFWALEFVGRVALISMVRDVEAGVEPGVRDGFRYGFSVTTLKVIAQAVLVGVILMLIYVSGFLLAAVPGLVAWFTGVRAIRIVGIAASVLVFLAVVLVMLVLKVLSDVLLRLAWRDCTLGSGDILRGLGAAWQFMRSRAKDVFVIWLLLFGVGLLWGVVSFVVVIPLLAGAVGTGFALIALFRELGFEMVGWALGVLAGMLIVFLPSAFVNGLFETFKSSAWTLTYLELTRS